MDDNYIVPQNAKPTLQPKREVYKSAHFEKHYQKTLIPRNKIKNTKYKIRTTRTTIYI